MRSPCNSNKHSEYSCLIKWGVSSKKFKVDKWCEGCIQHYSESYLVQEYLTTNERETKKQISDNESKPRRGRKKKAA